MVALLFHKMSDGLADILRVLGTRIVLGNHDAIGILTRSYAHGLATIHALAARSAKRHSKLSIGIVLAQIAQHGLETHAVVRKVDYAHDGSRLGGIHLHTAGNANLLETVNDSLFLNAQGLGAGDSAKHIGDIELNRCRHQHVAREARSHHRSNDTARAMDKVRGIDVGIAIGKRVRHHALANVSRLEHLVHVIHIQIHHSRAALLEDLELGGKVVLKCWMLDGRNMVLANVGKRSHSKIDAIGALVFERLARGLHDHMLAATYNRIRKPALELKGFGRRELGNARFDTVIKLDARKQSRCMATRKARVRVKHSLEIVSACGLALGTREGTHPNLSAGVVIGHVCQAAQRTADIADDDAGNIDPVIDFGNVGNGPRLNRLQ